MTKKNINVAIQEVDFYGDLSNSIAQLQKYQDAYSADHTRLYLDGDLEYYQYSDDKHYVLRLMGERLENDAEYEKRLAEEAGHERKQIDHDRRQYEMLKKKFEGESK